MEQAFSPTVSLSGPSARLFKGRRSRSQPQTHPIPPLTPAIPITDTEPRANAMLAYGRETSPGMRHQWELQQSSKQRLPRIDYTTHSPQSILDFAHSLDFTPDPAQQTVLRRGRRGIVNCTRQWGKSTVTALKAVHRAWSAPESLVLVLSPSGRQTGEFLRKAAAFVRKLKAPVRGDGDNELSLLLPNNSRIVGLPGNETTTRGFSAVSLLLIDEAARVPDEIYFAMRPTLAVADGDLWLMSTPNGKAGFFWEEWEQGGEVWQRVTVAAEDCPRIPARFLAEERARLGDRWFRQEYNCEFLDRDGAIFPRDLIDAALTDDGERLPL